MFFKQLFTFSTLVAVSLAVSLGGSCNPLNPCDEDGNMACTHQGDLTYKCECKSGNTPNQDGKACTGTYGESCHVAGTPAYLNCNHDRGLACMGAGVVVPYGHCECPSPKMFNEETASCVGVEGAPCDPDSTDVFGRNCMPHSTCDVDTRLCKCDEGFESNEENKCQRTDGGLGFTCTTDFDCDWNVLHLECHESKTCQCAKSQLYHEIQNGTCVRDFGASCTSLDPCDHNRFQKCSSFSAVPGECRCSTPEFMVFNPLTLFCDSIISQRCGEDMYVPGIDCIDNAHCIPYTGDDGGSQKNECVCLNDFLPTHDLRTCRPREQHELGDSCDPIGIPCSMDSASVCSAESNTCVCPDDKSPNKVGTRCYARHGETCNDEKRCNDDRWMECYLGRCACNIGSGEVWDANKGSCVGLVGAWCTEDSTPWDLLCTTNAHCLKLENGKRCECNEGFSEDSNRRCVPNVLDNLTF